MRFAAACLALLAGCAGAPARRYELPTNASATVIELRRNTELLVRLQADGMLFLRSGMAHASPREIEGLLRFIIEDQRFFEIDPQALKLAIHQANSRYGSAIAVMEGMTTAIEVTLRDRHHAVEQYALAFYSQRYAKVAGLQRLAAIEHHLIRFVAIKHLGGEKVAQRMLNAANARIEDEFPDVPPLTMDNLVTAGTRRDGALVAHFRRAASPTTVTMATVVLPHHGDPVAQVRSNEKPPA